MRIFASAIIIAVTSAFSLLADAPSSAEVPVDTETTSGPIAPSGGSSAGDIIKLPDENAAIAQIGITIIETPAGSLLFSPQTLHAEAGESARITLTNRTDKRHEVFLGSQQEIEVRRVWRARNPHAPWGTDDTFAVPPGGEVSVLWRFSDRQVVDFACLLPGHRAAGLRGLVLLDRHP